MTNEQAIKWLRFNIEMMRFDPTTGEEAYLDGDAENVIKAQEMAIEALSCSEEPNRSEPKTADSGSVEKEMPEIKSNRTTGGMIYRHDAIDVVKGIDSYFVKYIEGLPSAQPEQGCDECIFKPFKQFQPELIRCKDCKDYQTDWETSYPNRHYCATMDSFMPEDGFCSYAERKDNE